MRPEGRGTLRTSGDLRQLHDRVVGSAHALATARRFAFRNAHRIVSYSLI